MAQLKRAYLSGLLKGYKKANALIASEKRRRLAQITIEDSLSEYDNLCKLYAALDKKGLERLEPQKILFLIKRRHSLNNAARLRK